MARELQYLRLQDDLEQAAKEITHLQNINDSLYTTQSTCNGELSKLNIEVTALRLERDELRNIIHVADSGIADISDHWKQKFFSWRETETALRKEINENRTQIEDLIAERKADQEEWERKSEKLLQDNAVLVEKNKELTATLSNKETEMEHVSCKLVEESKKGIQLMFVARENDILQEKLRVLENKVSSFYDQSSKQQYPPDPDREMEERYRAENSRLKTELSQRTSDLRHLQEELGRTNCLNETQASKMAQLRKQSETSNESVANAALSLSKEREKCRRANDKVNQLEHQVATLTKITSDLKGEVSLKMRLLQEKDNQISNYRTSYQTLEEKVGKNISDMDQYRATVETSEKENRVLVQKLEDLKQKHAALIKRAHNLEEDKMALERENDECNSKIRLLSNQYREAELGTTNADRALGQWQQRVLDLEMDLNEKVLQINETSQENARLSSEVSSLTVETGRLNDVVLEKAGVVRKLQEELVAERARADSELSKLKDELVTKQAESMEGKSLVSVPSVVLVDVACETERNEPPPPSNHRLHQLEIECEMRERKLNHAKMELQKQATKLIESQCLIDTLQVKLAAARCVNNKSSRSRQQSSRTEELARLQSEIRSLQQVIADREGELEGLRETEMKLKEQNQAYGELGELVETLQRELEEKHSSVIREMNFYKDRLMRYEQGLCNGVSKGINTSPAPVAKPPSTLVSTDIKPAPPSPVNLKELVNVMDNLKCEYQVGLDRIYGEFQDRVSEYPECL
eukprot:sb/3462365/